MLKYAQIFNDHEIYYFYANNKINRIRTYNDSRLPVFPGWGLSRIILGMDNLNIVQLQHSDGNTGLWILDGRFNFMSHDINNISSENRAELLRFFPHYPEIEWAIIPPENPYPLQLFDKNFREYHCLENIDQTFIDGIKIFKKKNYSELIGLQSFWNENEYLKIEDALTEEVIDYLDRNITFTSKVSHDDPRQFYRMHNDISCNDFMKEFHRAVQEYYEAILSSNLARCAGFAMRYVKNSDLRPHYDNISTQISSTICYRFDANHRKNPLFIDRAKFLNPFQHRVTINDKDNIPLENIVRIDLEPGDLAVFRGRTHLHWREEIDEDVDYRAVLIHFSESQYKGEMITPPMLAHLPSQMVDFENYEDFRKTYALYFERAGKLYT